VLKPGGHILAFGGSRTWHRLAVAVEDAGFELRDSIAWIYGSGFPKSLDVSKAIDKAAGAEREVVGVERTPFKTDNARNNGNAYMSAVTGDTRPLDDDGYQLKVTTAAATSNAKEWEGWGTALKPAFEPVVVGRKPFGKGVTVAENVLAWGVGGLNIDGSRIGTEHVTINTFDNGAKPFGDAVGEPYTSRESQGRWPANVILDEVTAGLLDEQSGVSVSRAGVNPEFGRKGGIMGVKTLRHDAGTPTGHNDSGGASRFFYVAKASKRDRNEGLEELEARSAAEMTGRKEGSAGLVMKHVDGSDKANAYAGTTGSARQNFHPTVKPTALMRYLIKLVTPEGGVVLDPFTGSGSTGKAALLDGFQFVGVELTEEYLPIIEGRLRWASEQVDDDDTLF
jgi:site-specific DNA-methyltransferase (adenine-specific)